MYLLILMIPLLGAFITGFGGYFLGSRGASFFAPTCLAICWFLCLISFYEVTLAQSPCYLKIFSWVDLGLFNFSWGLMFDSLTVTMLVVVTTVSTIVHFYSVGYMSADPHVPRFISYLSLFTFFMIILVTADNFVQMFVGWEGVGLCSYLLINFWHTRLQANKSAIKAVIVNRVGDFGLVLGLLSIFYVFKSFDYNTVFTLVPFLSNFIVFNIPLFGWNIDILVFICIFLFVGAVGKSAQLGLHTWLPDAMEGPTPVSALIHAATMVTAGVFLIARCSLIFEYAPLALSIVTVFGALTAFFAATTALVQNDLKRVIAYSTCSQLGYMVFACGTSNYNVGVFHLANHAFFKALLFLTAGAIIHALADEQDMRKMGGLVKILPYSYAMIMIGSLSLAGFPFLTGFYSKDAILEMAYGSFTITSHFAHWLGTGAAFLTAFYSIRLIYLTFLNKSNAFRVSIEGAHDMPKIMGYPLIPLIFGSIFVGYLTKDMIIGPGTLFWQNALFVLPENLAIFDAEFLPQTIKLIPVIFSLSGVFLAILFYGILPLNFIYSMKMSPLGQKFYLFFNRKWFFDKVYNEYINQPILNFGYNISYKIIDRGVIENLGPFGLSQLFYSKQFNFLKYQTGLLYHYAFMMLICSVFFITLLGFSYLCYFNLIILFSLLIFLYLII
mgnify:FL=1